MLMAGSIKMSNFKKRTVVFFDDRFFQFYGGQVNIRLAAEVAKDAGHNVVLVTSRDGALSAAFKESDIEVKIIEMEEHLYQYDKQLIAHSPSNKMKSLFAIIGYSKKIKKYLTEISADVFVVGSIRSSVLVLFSRFRMPKTHNILYLQNSTNFGLYSLLSLLFYNRIMFIAEGAKKSVPKLAFKLVENKSSVLYSGRDLSRIQSKVNWNQVDENFLTILTVCLIEKRKGIDLIIKAIKKYQDEFGACAKLIVVGDAKSSFNVEHKKELEKLAQTLAVKVDFVGFHEDVNSFYLNADIFVLSSYDEGLPGVLIEAMAAALPCICTGVGGTTEIVQDKTSGYVVRKGDFMGIKESIYLLKDERKRREFGLSGKEVVSDKFSISTFEKEFLRHLN